MSDSISHRVGAFILRKNAKNSFELLLFKPANIAGAPVRVPGGGIEPGESAEEALHREIDEESGLKNLKIIRKLGTLERCWIDTQKTVCRHYYLLETQSMTPDSWDYIVQGEGQDAGLCFSFFWHRPTPLFKLEGGASAFLNPTLIPELYEDIPMYSTKLPALALKA